MVCLVARSERFSHRSRLCAYPTLIREVFRRRSAGTVPRSRLLRAQRSGGGAHLSVGVFLPVRGSATRHPAQPRPRPAGLEQRGLAIRRVWRQPARDRSRRTARARSAACGRVAGQNSVFGPDAVVSRDEPNNILYIPAMIRRARSRPCRGTTPVGIEEAWRVQIGRSQLTGRDGRAPSQFERSSGIARVALQANEAGTHRHDEKQVDASRWSRFPIEHERRYRLSSCPCRHAQRRCV